MCSKSYQPTSRYTPSLKIILVVSIAEPRAVMSPSSPHLVSVGSQISLLCTTTGDPRPSVRWTQPGSSKSTLKPVEINPGVWQVVIEEIKLEDQGSYSCIASSVAGRAEASIDLVGKL